MSAIFYYIICAVLSILILLGISMMSKVKTAVLGNRLSALGVFVGVIVTLLYYNILTITSIYLFIAIGLIIGLYMAKKVKMIEMPQMVALLNGIGGAASAIVGALTFINPPASDYPTFAICTALLAVIIGMVTLIGSLVAAGKLHKILPQKPVIFSNHQLITITCIIIAALPALYILFTGVDIMTFMLMIFDQSSYMKYLALLGITIVFSGLFGYFFSIRVGGADMPITISLLNSLSGVAGAIAGMAINDILLVAVGGIVGASGLLLTQIMCRAMNRSLMDILLGKTSARQPIKQSISQNKIPKDEIETKHSNNTNIISVAKNIIIIPGYGMALAQAQHQVKQLADQLTAKGAKVRFAIHPVAGRMPGHMNVLLAEANVPYDELYEMEQINDDFTKTDLVIVIGANDVINPAAREAEGTPIYGMPVLNADKAKNIVICNFDTKPGYAGVDNPLYKSDKTTLLLGDAKESLNKLLEQLHQEVGASDKKTDGNNEVSTKEVLDSAKEIIITPGYGMALAQAQHQVKQLADQLTAKGAKVRFAIHPVAGRMPGHMNVLLAEANVPYDELYEMEQINDDFTKTDLVIVIGANDVINPAAREAEGTPIYGMPVLNVDKAKRIIICNFDTKPGYAGVDNPLYKSKNTLLMLGDAKESLSKLIAEV